MNSAFHQGTLYGAWITPVEAISRQPQKERLSFRLFCFSLGSHFLVIFITFLSNNFSILDRERVIHCCKVNIDFLEPQNSTMRKARSSFSLHIIALQNLNCTKVWEINFEQRIVCMGGQILDYANIIFRYHASGV